MPASSRFKTPEAAARFFAAYQATLALWPVPHEAHDVTTGFGTTHINIAGSPDSPPLLLIHGAQVSSTQWYPNVGPLSRRFHVYALDVVDQIGLSMPTRKLKTPRDCSDWLIEVLDALHLEQVTIVGHSEGGWQALNLALTAPQRVARLVLLSPAPAFAPVRKQLFLRMIPVFLMPTNRTFYWYFQWTTTMPLEKGHPLVEQFITGIRTFKPQNMALPVISVFTDEELRRINIPTLLLIGDHEVVYNPSIVLERAQRLIPQIKAELIAGGGHLFPVDQAEATNAQMIKFLEG